MNTQVSEDSSKARFAITLQTAVIALLALTIANAVWTYSVRHKYLSSTAKGDQAMQSLLNKEALAAMERKKSELESQSRTEAASAAVAFAIQNDALRQVRKLINSLESLLAQITNLGNGFAELKTNETGRAVAQNQDLVAAMHHLYEKDTQTLASSEEIAARLTDVRRLEVVLVDSLGSRDKPESAFLAQITNGMAWATMQSTNTHRIQLMLKTLTREAKFAAVPGASQTQDTTLENAMEEFALDRAKEDLKHLVVGFATEKPSLSNSLAAKPEARIPALPLVNPIPANTVQPTIPQDRSSVAIGFRPTLPNPQTRSGSFGSYEFPPPTTNASVLKYIPPTISPVYLQPKSFNPPQAYQPQPSYPPPRSYSFPGGSFKLFEIYHY